MDHYFDDYRIVAGAEGYGAASCSVKCHYYNGCDPCILVLPTACIGDCDGSGKVTVGELVLGAGIALGEKSVSACVALDGNADRQCTVDELVQAVNAALEGCPVPPIPTPTATPELTPTVTPTATVPEPEGRLVRHGTCKPGTRLAMRERASDQDCLEWEYSDGTLSITHVNAGFNCCPTELLGEVTVEANTITIKEQERLENPCDCLCLYDLEYTINNLGPGDYAISVEEPYVDANDPQLSTSMTLRDGTPDSFCVKRTEYPWGVY